MPKLVFVDVGALAAMPREAGLACAIAPGSIAVFRAGDRLYAIDDTCARCNGSLASGTLDGMHVTCGCGWRYDIARGCVAQVPGMRIDVHAVKVVGAQVLVARDARRAPLARGAGG